MKKILFFLFGFFSLLSSNAQSFSNKGKDFWVAYGYHVRMAKSGSNSPINGQDMRLYFATDQVTTITITIPGTAYSQTLVSGATPTVLVSDTIPKSGVYDARLTAESSSPQNNKSIHITSDKPIVAYAHIYDQSVSGATILFPTTTLGKEYYSINYKGISNEDLSNTWFYVIATDTGTTTIEVTPSQATINHPAGIPYTVNMTQGQVFNFMGQLTGSSGGGGGSSTYTAVDLSGSKIKSIASGTSGCKKIAVFSGSGKLSITCTSSASSADNYMVQSFPKDAWGKKYLTVPTSSLNNNIFRVCVSDPATVVQLNGTALPTTIPLTNNFYYEIPATTSPLMITADLPVTVAQYIATQGACGNPSSTSNPGDPEVIYLSPVEQNISKVLWNATPNNAITEHYYNVVIPNTGTAISSFKLDGVAVNPASFTVHPQDAAYSYLSKQLSASGVHSIESDSGFNAIAYGFGAAESYGYNAGTNIRDLYNFLEPLNPYNISSEPIACSGTSFYQTVTFPFQPTYITWDFHNNAFQTPNATVTINAPVFDSTYFIGNKQVWRYKLPGLYNYTLANTNPGYLISLTAGTTTSEGCGNTIYKDFYLLIYDPPIAKFTWTNNGCVNDAVQFTDATVYTNGTYPYIWNWNYTDGSTATIGNPSHLFSAPGTYNVHFITTTNVGCVNDTTMPVTLYPLPSANISGSTTVCKNATPPLVKFTATSGTAPFVFTYTINGGANLTVTATGTSNTVNVSVPTTTAGTFVYTLVSVKGANCLQAQTGSATIIVNPLPTATVTGTTSVCKDAISPNITFTGAGATSPYTFTYKINNGANLTVTTTSGNSVTITAPTNVAGTFTYTLVSIKDASSTVCSQLQTGTVVIQVNPLPTATILGNTAVCLTATSPSITFTGAGATPPYTFTYTINNGPALTVSTITGSSVTVPVSTSIAGTFVYSLVSIKEASSTTCSQAQIGNVSVTVYPLPVADFTYSLPACPAKTISFTDASIPNVGTLTQWHWDFGDGTPVVTTQNPVHTFVLAGNYQVKLYVKTNNGCKSIEIPKTVTIFPTPVAGFINPEVCLSDTYAQFNDTSNVLGGTITNWLWDFGDPINGPVNNVSTLQNPRHSYSTIGTKNVKLIITSNNGCKDTTVQTFFVNGDIPVAGVEVINPGSLCANTAVSIKNTSTVNVGSVVKVHIYWDNLGAPTVFEIDDLPLPGKIYNHLYPNFQTPLVKSYRIRFRAFSGETCINDTYKDITVNAAPEVLFTSIPNSCLYVPSFQLTQASETGAVPGTFAYSGLGASAAGMFNPATTGPGSFVLTYTFTSNAGCVDTAQQLIKVLQPPLPNFGFTLPVCETRSITVTDSCSSSAGTITNWLWNLGDGTASFVRTNNTAFTHTYASAGSFDITLKLVTSDGCISIVKTKQILVNPQPKAQFTFTDTACLPNAFIQFNNTSSIADGTQNQFRYLWSFGDLPSGIQNTSTDINPSHTYLQLGPFAVKLIVTSNIGCADDTTIAVNTIHARPKADFIINKPSVCLGDVVQLTDQSDFKDGTFSQWFWNWGDNVLAYDQSSSHIFASTGSYDITHYIVNSFGCRSDTASKRFEVYPFPVANAGPDQMVLEGASTRLEATASGNDLLFNWASGDYLNNTTALNPTCTPIKDITYTLTVTGRGGCPISDQVKINVLKVPAIPNTFTPNGDGINDVWEIKYLSRYPTAKVQVFTRSGQLVFESKGYTKPWDGMKNGQPLPVDTYYYIIEPESGRAPVTGYITIVK